MKRFIRLLVLVLLPAAWNPLAAQADTSFHLLRRIPGTIVDFTVDNLDNVYVLNDRNRLVKYSPDGDSLGAFNDVRKFGQVSTIDASNPLRILLYYKDFTTIVILDRFLNVRNTIDLRKQQLFQVTAVGQSYDNKIWLYDEQESKLRKIDEDGKLLLATPDLRLLTGTAPMPVRLYDENKYVYLCDPANGIYVFDYFGSLKNVIEIRKWQNLKVAGKYIFGSLGSKLYRYDISTFRYDEWQLPAPLVNSLSFNFSAARIYALKKDGLDIYRLQ